MFYRFCRFICLIAVKILFRLKVTGKENIPAEEGFIIASNHVSNLDPVIIGVACPRIISFIAKIELFQLPLIGWIFNAFYCIPVRRTQLTKDTFKKAVKCLSDGGIITIFPEGTRGRGEQKKDPLAGVGYLASKSKVKVVPAYIKGSDKALGKGKKIPRPHKIEITFGKPINFSDFKVEEDKDLYKEISRTIMGEVESLSQSVL